MHREDFERRLARFTHSDAYSVSRQDVTEDEKRRWIFHVHREAPLIRWGALIGECFFNYRSALDHLALISPSRTLATRSPGELRRSPSSRSSGGERRRPKTSTTELAPSIPMLGASSNRCSPTVERVEPRSSPRRSAQLRQASNPPSGRRSEHRRCLLRRPARLRGLRQFRPAQGRRPSRSDSTQRRAPPRPRSQLPLRRGVQPKRTRR
jgi:hypothetical protein